jgi:DNA-directed RNA polymerase specialized sigma24 family protein
MNTKSEPDLTPEEWLMAATAAALSGDGVGLARAIWASGLPQHIAFSLARSHKAIDNFQDAEFIVAGAVGKLYTKVVSGETVDRPKALLWQIAEKDAVDYARAKKRQHAEPLDENAPGTSLTSLQLAPRSESEEASRREAVQRLRGYVARLGPGRSVTRLWMVLVEAIAVERTMGRADLAAELGITKNHVGVLVHRGKKEIQQMLRDEGLGEAADALEDIAMESSQSDAEDADDEPPDI